MGAASRARNTRRTSRDFLWTMDLFELDVAFAKAQIRFTSSLFRDEEIQLQPLFVFRDVAGGQSPHFAWCTEVFKTVVTKLAAKNVREGRILTQIPAPYNVRAMVRALLSTPLAKSAPLIIAATAKHSRLSRFLLGSFAETLLLTSRRPLLFFNSNTPVPRAVKSIVFPTDFSEESFRAFKICVQRASAIKAQVLLYYAVNQKTFDPSLTKRYLEEKNLTATWIHWAAKSGVKITPVIEAAPTNAATAIIRFALKKKASLIALASVSTPMEVIIAGSTTRQVVRQSPLPVWVVTPDSKGVY